MTEIIRIWWEIVREMLWMLLRIIPWVAAVVLPALLIVNLPAHLFFGAVIAWSFLLVTIFLTWLEVKHRRRS